MFCGQACAVESRQPTEPVSWRHNEDGYLVGEYCVRGVRHFYLQHRWVMEQALGRLLEDWEVVHHINHVRDDNRLENLEIRRRVEHLVEHLLERPRKRGYRQNLTAEQRQILSDRVKAVQPWRFHQRYRQAHPEETQP